MLLGGKQLTKNKSKMLMLGFFVSLTTIILASCAHNNGDTADAKIENAGDRQVRAYTVIPFAKPIFIHAKKILSEKTDKLVSETQKSVPYLSSSERAYKKVGRASWYGEAFNGRLTANGEIYNMHNLTAAHPTMPLPSYARVTNLENGSSIIVRVNDRGPFVAGRVIDLSKRAATMLDYKDDGLAAVRVEYIGRAPIEGNDEEFLVASYKPRSITVDTLLAMAGMNLVNSFGPPVRNDNDFTNDEEISGQTEMNVSFPKLPNVGPFPAFKPEIAQLLAFVDEPVQTNKQQVFDSVLKADNNKTDKHAISYANSPFQADEQKSTNRVLATTTSSTVDETTSVERALRLAWATGVSQAFSIGSAQ